MASAAILGFSFVPSLSWVREAETPPNLAVTVVMVMDAFIMPKIPEISVGIEMERSVFRPEYSGSPLEVIHFFQAKFVVPFLCPN